MSKKNFIDFILGVILFAGLWYALSVSTQPVAETIPFNGKIITVDPDFSYQQAVAIADGKILALGSDQEMEKLAGPRTRKIDLGGRSVIPGLADNPLHSAGGGLAWIFPVCAPSRNCSRLSRSVSGSPSREPSLSPTPTGTRPG
ncbi:MAG: hypothetical protein IH790_10500 [Acidobacteria bacterium]|nr:hypothetical protein [Acidobacteriota bacterium]